MKSMAAAVLTVAALAFSGTAMAQQERTYFGGSLAWADYKENGFPTATPTVLAGRFGKEFNRHFAVEGRLGFGIADDTITAMGIPISIDVDHFFGVYARGILPLADIFSIYGLVGFTFGKISASAPGVSISDSDSDISFGFGADLSIGKNLAINFEWAKLFEGAGYEVEATSVGIVYRY
jgi:outer membrane immunogenic protein